MQPFQTKAEIAEAQKKCQHWRSLVTFHSGFRRMRLIWKAFPFAASLGPAKGGLHVTVHEKEQAYVISDGGGFITLIPFSEKEDYLSQALWMEHEEAGAFREFITGEKRTKPTPPAKMEEKPKKKISLQDLDLKF